jgi:diazepam-binding inhibitor (GABA receptor modulator, acyl-CoA-binding protein)
MSAFQNAAKAIKDSGKEAGIQKITNDEKLNLYGLFKQATEGDNTAAAPWAVQLEAKAKWEAWSKQKGKGKETAEAEYIELVKQLLTKYGVAQYIQGF